jgi:hypothetical protein
VPVEVSLESFCASIIPGGDVTSLADLSLEEAAFVRFIRLTGGIVVSVNDGVEDLADRVYLRLPLLPPTPSVLLPVCELPSVWKAKL